VTKALTPRQLGWLRGRVAIAEAQPNEADRLLAFTRLAVDLLPENRLVELRERLTEEVRRALPVEV